MMGKWYDHFRDTAIQTGNTATQADAIAGSNTFMKVAIMPAIVLVVFILIYVARRRHYQKKIEIISPV
jgi:uncharacterized membrane protein YoaK (UPF0700 family)